MYDVAREVTDEVMGAGTYRKLNGGSPNPLVRAAAERDGVRMARTTASVVFEITRDDAGTLRARREGSDDGVSTCKPGELLAWILLQLGGRAETGVDGVSADELDRGLSIAERRLLADRARPLGRFRSQAREIDTALDALRRVRGAGSDR